MRYLYPLEWSYADLHAMIKLNIPQSQYKTAPTIENAYCATSGKEGVREIRFKSAGDD